MIAHRYHIPSAGVLGLVLGGVFRILAANIGSPDGLVWISQLILWMSVVWLLVFDFFPIFIYPFYILKRDFQRRYTFMAILFALFAILQALSFFIPSGATRDTLTLLGLLSFVSAALWGISLLAHRKLKPAIEFFKYKRYADQNLTSADIITSLAIIIIPSVILSFYFSGPGLSATTTTPYQSFITSLVTNIFMAGYLVLFVVRPKLFTWKQLGIRKVDREELGRSLSLFIFASVLIFIFHTFLNRLGVPLQHFSFDQREGAIFAVIVLVVVTPIVEEIYFRGFLFRGLLVHHKPWVAYLVSAGIFALFHPPLLVMIDVLGIGLLLAYVAQRTKSIWPCVMIHALNNAIVLTYLLQNIG